MVERLRAGERRRHGGAVERHLAGQRAPPVPVGDHAVRRAHLEVVHVNADHVADLRATDLDRPGDDVRSLTRDISVQIRRRHRDRVVEHTRRIDAVAGEERHRVTALVLEDALVADGIDHDEIARINRRHERRVLVGQPAPRRGLWRRGQMMV